MRGDYMEDCDTGVG